MPYTNALSALLVLLVAGAQGGPALGSAPHGPAVYFQAHRGGLREVPENTLAAYTYAWQLGGMPEIDMRTTKDGVIVCLHDDSLARTTDADDAIKDLPVAQLTYEQVRSCDSGVKFGPVFKGERVPALREVYAAMQGHPERQVYLDFKDADLEQLADLIDAFDVENQIIFSHNNQDNCIRLRDLLGSIRTMLWIGGEPEEIKATFERVARTGFEGLDQVQLHLHDEGPPGRIEYAIDADFLRGALAKTAAAGVDLEVLPFAFDAPSLRALLDLGIRWYATDEPRRFTQCVRQWRDAVPSG